MYVRWKVLIGLGTVFWLLLCLCDYLAVKQIDTILAERERHVKDEHEVLPKIEPPKKDEENLGFVKVMLWNLIAFASTISACFILKSMSSRFNIINNKLFSLGQDGKLTLRKTSSSRIPIPITSKTSSTDIHIGCTRIESEEPKETEYNKSCPNLLGFQEAEQKSNRDDKHDKKMCSIKIMENHCAKLREEMIHLQATALKEQANITKKMETLTKEKRDLLRQFNSVSKENKTLKQQLNEMIDERTLLIKRLECATKEMKIATKNKRATIAKLDETVANAETLKTNLEQIKRDKVNLEDKLIILDAEYKRLKEEVELYRQKENEFERKLANEKETDEPITIKKDVIDKYELDTEDKNEITQTEENEYDVCKSNQDIKKVQEKLLSLEKSLENFKLRHEYKSKEIEINNNNDTATFDESKPDETELSPIYLESETNSRLTLEEQPSTNSICTEPDCPLEHRECLKAECFLKRKLKDTDISSSGEEISQYIHYNNYIILNKQIPKLKSSISDDRLSVISERATSTGDDSGDDWNEPKRRIVSHSPAFQKFLREIIDAHANCQSRNDINELSE